MIAEIGRPKTHVKLAGTFEKREYSAQFASCPGNTGQDDDKMASVDRNGGGRPYWSSWTVAASGRFAMDATRPNDLGAGELGRRFYVICEADRSFRAISAGHGGGHDLKGIVDFANARRCAKNFGNAMDSNLTAGGPV